MRLALPLLAAVALAAPTPALAQVDTSTPSPTQWDIPVDQGYNPRQALVPYSRTNAIKNQIGQAVQKSCLRNGRAAAACSLAAATAGGIGVARAFDHSWSHIATTVGTNIGVGAVSGAVTSCVAGAAVGAWFGGVGAIPGCGAGIVTGALAGGFFGLANGLFALTQDNSIQVNAQGNVVGPAIQESVVHQAPAGTIIPHFRFVPNSTTSSYQTALNQYGFNRTFLCSTGAAGVTSVAFNECFFYDSLNSRDGDAYGIVRSNDSFQTNPKWGFCAGDFRPNTCAAGYPVYKQLLPAQGTITAISGVAAGHSVYLMSRPLGTADINNPPQIAQVAFQPVQAVPAFASGWAPNIPARALDKPLSDAAVAGLANYAWQQAGAEAGEGAYNPAQPVTAADVQAINAELGQQTPLLRDLYRGIADLSAAGGTKENPLREPQTVNVINSGTGTQTGTQTGTGQSDKDLELEAGIPLGNPIQPVIDFLSGPLAPFISPNFTGVQGQCPVWTIDFNEWFGSLMNADWRGNAVAQGSVQAKARDIMKFTTAPACDFFDEWYTMIQMLIGLGIAIRSFFWFFE